MTLNWTERMIRDYAIDDSFDRTTGLPFLGFAVGLGIAAVVWTVIGTLVWTVIR